MATNQAALQILSQLGQTSLQSDLTERERLRELSKEKVEYSELQSQKMRGEAESAAEEANKKGRLFGGLSTLASLAIPGGTTWVRPLIQSLLAGVEAKGTKAIYKDLSKKEFGKDTFFGGYGRQFQEQTKQIAESIDPSQLAFTKGITAFAMDKMTGKIEDVLKGDVTDITVGGETVASGLEDITGKTLGDVNIDPTTLGEKFEGLSAETPLSELLEMEGVASTVGPATKNVAFGKMHWRDKLGTMFKGDPDDYMKTLTSIMTRLEPAISGTAAGLPEYEPSLAVPSQAELYRLFSEKYS